MFAGLAVALVLCAGCQKSHDANTVATVNGKPILRSDVETLFQNNLGDSHQTPSAIQAKIMRLNIVRQLIDEEIVMQRAAKQNLVATDEEVSDRLNEIKAPFTQEEFQKRLDSQHMTLDDLKREIRRNRTEEKLFNKEITSRINITDADIAAYYNEHKADFNLIEPNYHLAQIIVTATPDAAAAGGQSAEQQGDERGGGEAEDRGAAQQAGERRRLRCAGDELLGESEYGRQWRRYGVCVGIAAEVRCGGLRGDLEAEAGADYGYSARSTGIQGRSRLWVTRSTS